MDKNIILIVVLIIVLVTVSIAILFWQFDTQPLGTVTPIATSSPSPTASPTPEDPTLILEKDINSLDSADITDEFQSIDSDINDL